MSKQINKLIIILLVLMNILLLSGCTNTLGVELPDDPIEFVTYDFDNPDNPDDEYMAFDYDGRTYILYGTLNGVIHKSALGGCLGYLTMDNGMEDDKGDLVVTLKSVNNYDILMNYYINDGTGMNDPVFFRAIDTQDKDIEIPNYISPSTYEFWE